MEVCGRSVATAIVSVVRQLQQQTFLLFDGCGGKCFQHLLPLAAILSFV
jgi:hypothetical protein